MGSYGSKHIALSYAAYLSVEFHVWMLKVVEERMEEEKSPELAYSRGRERAVRGWEKEGKDKKWIDARLKGIEKRNEHTHTLKEHGVKEPQEFAQCTDATYKPILGGSAKLVKARRGIPAKLNLRDNLSEVENAAIYFSEILADEKIIKESRHGVDLCAEACELASKNVAQAVKNMK